MGRVGEDAAIVVNGELLSEVVFALVEDPVRRLLPGESDLGVRPIAVRLVLRLATTAQRDRPFRCILFAIQETLQRPTVRYKVGAVRPRFNRWCIAYDDLCCGSLRTSLMHGSSWGSEFIPLLPRFQVR